MVPKVSVFIPVLNEEEKIEGALISVGWADEIVVIDTGCTDNTIEIAKRYTQRIVAHPFKGFGDLRNFGVSACSHEWIFSLDADERCTAELKTEIDATIHDPEARDAYFIPRRNWFMGRWIKRCGWYPDYCQPKLFRRGALYYHDVTVHEGFDIHGSIGYLNQDVLHLSFGNLSQVIAKMNRYSSLGAIELLKKKRKAGMARALSHAIWAFIRIYIIKFGFLDGWAGFVIAFGNFEGTFYRYAKLHEKQQRWDQPSMLP